MNRRWRRLQARVRHPLRGAMSLRLRLMLGATGLAALFMLALLPALQGEDVAVADPMTREILAQLKR